MSLSRSPLRPIDGLCIALLLASASALAGCGASYRIALRADAPTLTAADVEARLALGAALPRPGADGASEIERLLSIAEYVARSEPLPADVDLPLYFAVTRARLEDALHGSDPAVRARRRDTERRAIELAARAVRPNLVIELALGAADPPMATVEAALAEVLAVDDDLSPLWPRLSPTGRASAEILEAVPVGADPAPLSVLASLGGIAVAALERRLEDAALTGDRTGVSRVARALGRADPYSVRARAVILAEREVESGVLSDAEIVRDVASATPRRDGWPFARLLAARDEHPASEAIVLALALDLLEAEASPDALDLAAALARSRETSAPARETARILVALARFDLADAERWNELVLADPGLERSASAAPIVANRTGTGTAHDELDLAVRSARLAQVAAGTRSERILVAVASDDEAPLPLRRVAIERLAPHWPSGARAAAACVAEELEQGECEDRLSVIDAVGTGELPSAEVDERLFSRIGATFPAGAATFFAEVPAPTLDEAARHLERFESSSIGVRAGWVMARASVAARAGDRRTLERLLEERGALLGPGARALVRAAIVDLRAGRAVEPLAVDPGFGTPMLLGEPSEEAPASEAVPASATAALSCLEEAELHRIEHLRRCLDVATTALGDSEPGLLAAQRGLVLVAQGAEVDLGALLRAAEASDEDDTSAVLLRALAADARGDLGAAAYAYARLVAVPRGGFDALLRMITRGDTAGFPLRDLATVAGVLDGPTTRAAVALVEDGTVTDAAGLAGLLTHDLDTMRRHAHALASFPAFSGALDFLFEVDLMRRIGTGTAAEARALAAAELPAARAREASSEGGRAMASVLAVLAGDATALSSVADRPARDGRDSEPLSFDDPLREIAAVDARLGPEVVRTLVLALAERSYDAALTLLRDVATRDPAVAPLLCTMLVAATQAEEAARVCVPAYLATPTPLLAARVGYAAVEVPEATLAAGLDPGAFFADAVGRFEPAAAGLVAWNASVHAATADPARSAELARMAEAHGYVPEAISLWEAHAAERRGLELRYRAVGSEEQPRDLVRAFTALAEGRAAVADLYLDALFHYTPPDALTELPTAFLLRDLVHWARADLEGERIDAAGIAEEERIRTTDLRADGIVELAARHPESSLLLLGLAVHAGLTSDARASAERAIELLERDPRPTVLAALRTQLAGYEGRDRASARLEALRLDYPDDPRLTASVEEPLPPSLATSGALATLLTSVTEADLGRLEPSFRISTTAAGGAAMTTRATPHSETLGVMVPGGALLVQVEPRPSECAPAQCLDVLVPALERTGLELVWRSEVTIPAGPGGRFLMRAGERLALFTIVPRGSRLYLLGLFGPLATVAGRLGSYALLERTFVPLDAVVPVSWAARIVGTPAAPWASYQRAIASLAAASSASAACPITAELALLTDAAQRAELVRVLYLGEGEPGRRRALLSCTDAARAPDGLLGLAAALDPDPAARTLGLPHLRAQPAPAVAALRELLAEPATQPLAGVPHRESDLPVFGLVEAVLALPEAERREMTRAMWERNEPRLRVLAGMADEVLPGSLDHAIVRDALRTGTTADALAITGALYQSDDEADFDAARARLDAIVAPFADPERELGVTLSWLLARRLASTDEARIRRFARRLTDAAGALADSSPERRLLEWTGERMNEQADVVRASLASGMPADEELAAQVEVYRGMHGLEGGHTSPAVARSLATESLARVLPGTHWSYVRVPSPALLGATLEAMYARLQSGSAADGAIARQALEWMLDRSNADLLGADGGLDMSRPIECATADRFPRAWVCAVYVADANTVRAHLARRRLGTNSGAWMIVEAASYARSLPIAAGAIPYELDDIMHADGPAPSSHLGAVLGRERARTEVDLDGVLVERYATFAAREGDTPMVDTEHYLFTGDRLVMFGLEETARVILAAPRPLARTLAGAPAFRTLTDGWREGAVLQLVNVDYRDRMLPSPLPHDDFGLEVVATDDGLVARIRMPFTDAGGVGVEELRARLPDGSISTLAFVPDADDVPETEPDAPPEGLGWQGLVIARSERFALGWYGATADEVWSRWLVAVRPTERLRTLLTRWSALPAAGATVATGGVVLGRSSDGVVFVGTDEAMVRDAMARPTSSPSSGGSAEIGAARLDGLLAAGVARNLAEGIRSEDPRRESLLFLGAMLGLAHEIGFEAAADADADELVISAHVRPNLGEPGEDHRIVDGALREARNGVTLPRAPTPSELRQPLRLVIETNEPEVVATRAFGGSLRVRAEPRSEGTLWVTIAPGTETAVALSVTERARLLSSPASIRSDAESVRTLARELAPAGTAPAAAASAIVHWVFENVHYELTAAELDAPTVLERRVGDCSELARVTVALLRASGIPAETREGFLVTGADLGAHAWVAYHDGTTFREIDPTAGRAEVDAGYIPSSVLTIMGLAALGELRITEVTRGD